MAERPRLGILISGGGTTMAEMVKAINSGEVPIDLGCIISSKGDAGGIEKAKALGVPDNNIFVVNPKNYLNSERKVDSNKFGVALWNVLKSMEVTDVTQNGWMPLTPDFLVEEYEGHIYNQHPGPVPDFGGTGWYGLRVHCGRLLFVEKTGRDSWTEVIAQRTDIKYDGGAVVGSERVEILPHDTPETLQQRALPAEHRVQIQLLKDIASGNVREQRRRHLVKPREMDLLEQCKQNAIALYPHG